MPVTAHSDTKLAGDKYESSFRNCYSGGWAGEEKSKFIGKPLYQPLEPRSRVD